MYRVDAGRVVEGGEIYEPAGKRNCVKKEIGWKTERNIDMKVELSWFAAVFQLLHADSSILSEKLVACTRFV